MNVADEVLEPYDVLGFDVVAGILANGHHEFCDLGQGIWDIRLVRVQVRWREWLIDEVPILVHEVVGIADVLRGFGAWGWGVAIVRAVGGEARTLARGLDAIRPCRRVNEGD